MSEDAELVEKIRAELLNKPELRSFADGVVLEAQHQNERWGEQHDQQKDPQDWYWALSYLAGKALRAHVDGDHEKAMHHCITSAALLAHWHERLSTQEAGSEEG